MNILFLGNSYTYYNNMPAIFESLATENGIPVSVTSVTKGGHYLRQVFEEADPCGMQLNELLKTEIFDFCFLQEQSTYPVRHPEAFLTDVLKVANWLKPCVKHYVMYATWGRQIGAKFLEESGLTTQSMSVELEKQYQSAAALVAKELRMDVSVSAVGKAFRDADPFVDLYNPDLSHPSYEGSCLAALVHYKTIFGKYPMYTGSLNIPMDLLNVFSKVLTA